MFSVPVSFHFPSFFYPPFLFQIGLSLLLATHQLHPRHLSKLFAYSLLITFPSFRQELPGSWHWHVSLPCFPYSCHAHSFPTGCLWGSSHRSLQSLWIGPVSCPHWDLTFKFLGLLSKWSFRLSLGCPSIMGKTLFQRGWINITCCSVFPRLHQLHQSLRYCLLTLQHKLGYCLSPHRCLSLLIVS